MTSESNPDLVVDTGPLSHLARAGWLSVLRTIAGSRKVVIPDTVEAELHAGLHIHPELQQVLDAGWIARRSLASPAELVAFSRFSSRLVAGTRNIGEAGVLAYAEVHNGIAVIDDRVAVRAARQASITVLPTLALLVEAIREGLLTVDMVGDVADHLLETDYQLPFGPGGFRRWANENGLNVGHGHGER